MERQLEGNELREARKVHLLCQGQLHSHVLLLARMRSKLIYQGWVLLIFSILFYFILFYFFVSVSSSFFPRCVAGHLLTFFLHRITLQ